VGESDPSDCSPLSLRLAEASAPIATRSPQPVVTLSSDDIGHFFVRVRRDQDGERWEVRLDAALREILERANEFVPSEAGGILLDDPRAKFAGSPTPRLTFIAAFGPHASERLGQRIPSDRGICGQVYRSGRPHLTESLPGDDPLGSSVEEGGGTADWTAEGPAAVQSVLVVPVIVGDSICGVIELTNRTEGLCYSPRDQELLRIFAAYISSSIQNALDAIRNRALARIDDLTGLYNSRHFHRRLQEEVIRVDRKGGELGVLFIDLDQLKAVNDRYGHLAGSAVLREVARVMREVTPPGAVLARYGGDEFVAILPNATLAQSVEAGETIRLAVERATALDPFDMSETSPLPNVTVSLGVASYRDHLAPGGSPLRRETVLLRLADTAMYSAKAKGRNRLEVAKPE
jgi:diguanylate cyclase (GGDEF)-like protein